MKKWLFDSVSRCLARIDEPFYTPVNWLANAILLLRHPERVTHPGTLHPDKTFYVIRDLPPTAGLASWLDRVAGYCIRAKKKGWTPVVVPNPPAQPDSGIWYDFFQGVSDVPVEEALQGKNVVNAITLGMIHKRYSKRNIRRRHEIYQGIGLSKQAKSFVGARLPALLEGIRIPSVAVCYRGTDYRAKGRWRPVGHASVPEMDDFIAIVEKDLAKWGLPAENGDNIFFMTEEQEALDAFLRRFPACHYVRRERFANFDYGKPGLLYLCYQRLPNTSPKENTMYYLLEILASARCDYLIGGYNGGVLAACNFNGNKYQGVHILKTGVS
jgi:hypothetical protein